MQNLARQRFPFFLIFLVCIATIIQWFLTDRHLLVVQTTFFACQTIAFTLALVIYFAVKKLASTPPSPGNEWPKDILVRGGDSISKQDYDLGEATTMIYGSFFSGLMALLVHYYGGYQTPLVLSSIICIKNVHEKVLFKIHVLGHDDKLYRRPFNGAFEAPPPLMMMFTDSEKYMELSSKPSDAAIAAAKKGGRRRTKKKLTGKEKRELKNLEKAKGGK